MYVEIGSETEHTYRLTDSHKPIIREVRIGTDLDLRTNKEGVWKRSMSEKVEIIIFKVRHVVRSLGKK